MTNTEAIAAAIEPYSVSENSLEKAFIDSCSHFGANADPEDNYTAAMLQPVSLAAMRILTGLKSLTNEKVDVISNSYDTKGIDKAIASIAASAGLDPGLVGDDSDNYGLTAVRCW